MKFIFSWNSIRFRLSTLLTLTIAGMGLTLAILAYVLIKDDLEENLKFFAHHEAQEVALVASNYSTVAEVQSNKARFDTLFPEENVVALQLWSLDETLVLELAAKVAPIPKWSYGLSQARLGELPYEKFSLNGRAASRAAQIVRGQSGELWIALAIVDGRPVQKALRKQSRNFAYGLALAVLLSFTLSWVLLTFALAHVQQMVSDARLIKIEGPGRRLAIPPEGSELAQLAQLLNSMLEGVEQSFLQLKRFTAHAGHELRTPLARMRAEAELALTIGDPAKANETMASLLEDITDLSQVIDALLELAMENKELHDVTTLSISSLASDLVEEFEVLAKDQGRALEIQLSSAELFVCGNKALLSRVFWNLFSNALKYSAEQSTLTFSSQRIDEQVLFRFGNEITEPKQELALDEIFEPFTRGVSVSKTDLKGYGLGLALTRSILKRHAGSIEARMKTPTFIEFTVTLRLAPQAL